MERERRIQKDRDEGIELLEPKGDGERERDGMSHGCRREGREMDG